MLYTFLQILKLHVNYEFIKTFIDWTISFIVFFGNIHVINFNSVVSKPLWFHLRRSIILSDCREPAMAPKRQNKIDNMNTRKSTNYIRENNIHIPIRLLLDKNEFITQYNGKNNICYYVFILLLLYYYITYIYIYVIKILN